MVRTTISRHKFFSLALSFSVALLLAAHAGTASAELTALALYGNAATNGGDSSGFTNPAAGEYTISARGTDFWNSSDQGAGLFDPTQKVSGDFDAVVRISYRLGWPASRSAASGAAPGSWPGVTPRGGIPAM